MSAVLVAALLSGALIVGVALGWRAAQLTMTWDAHVAEALSLTRDDRDGI